MGLRTSLLFANAGLKVTGVDLSEKKVDEINSGRFPFEEKGIAELFAAALKTENFKAQTKPGAADVFVVRRTESTQKQEMRFVRRPFGCEQPAFRHERWKFPHHRIDNQTENL